MTEGGDIERGEGAFREEKKVHRKKGGEVRARLVEGTNGDALPTICVRGGEKRGDFPR